MQYSSLPILIICIALYSCTTKYKITIQDGVMDEGQECFQINMANATLYYQKEAGGFSSIVDSEGNDWIGFRKDTLQGYPANAASEYRGLPNLVFRSDDGGTGHPGFDKCESELISGNQIKTTSKSGKWQWTWTFYPMFAEFLVEKVALDHTYWFLYEGIPGGKFKPQQQYWGTDKGGPNTTIPDYYFGNASFDTWQWVYFGDDSVDRILYILQVQPDEQTDTFSYLGNTDEGVISPDGMVVFGFGRDESAISLLDDAGMKFIFGFWEGRIMTFEEHRKFKGSMDELMLE